MTPCNPTNFIISQAITSAVDGVLAKYQHEHQELLRGFIETTARIFIQQQNCVLLKFLRKMTKMMLLVTPYLQKQTTASINFMNWRILMIKLKTSLGRQYMMIMTMIFAGSHVTNQT